MAVMRVNPTRMELTRLKKRLKTAARGHKLLKDKRDEMVKQFLEIVAENRRVRREVEEALQTIYAGFSVASAVLSPQVLEEALLVPKQSAALEVGSRNVMSVDVPVYRVKLQNDDAGDVYPYGFAFTSGELDASIAALSGVLPQLLRLAELEKSGQLLSEEIEKTRRRVNALEHVMIPQIEETIKSITAKLDENERGNLTRLMKVKDMMLEEARRKSAAQGQGQSTS